MIKGLFAKNLHKAVSERGIKQVELAGVLNVPATTVNGWMRGAHLPDIEKLMEICEYLDIPVGVLIGDKRSAVDVDTRIYIKKLEGIVENQKSYIDNLEDELKDYELQIEALKSELDADEGIGEICVNEFVLDTAKVVKDAGVKKITIEF